MSPVRRLTATGVRLRNATLALVLLGSTSLAQAGIDLIGVNLSAASFSPQVLPGTNGVNYVFPTEQYFKDWSARGVKTVRLPILWERLQPALMGPLDRDYADLIGKALGDAHKNGIRILLDLHNSVRYHDNLVGSDAVPFTAFTDLYARMALRFGTHPGLFGYDLSNEPVYTNNNIVKIMQAGVDGVRRYDHVHPVIIEGEGYSSAWLWDVWGSVGLLDIKDPANKLIYSAHTYLDRNNSGTYDHPDDAGAQDPMVGVNRLKPFVEWLKANNKQGLLGELGIPNDNPNWLVPFENTLKYLAENCVPVTLWAGGPGWGDYNLSLEPRDGQESPAWKIASKYLQAGQRCANRGPGPAGPGPRPGKATPPSPPPHWAAPQHRPAPTLKGPLQ